MSREIAEGEPVAADGRRRYGTLEGVFVPTLLTILGVIMYLRLGWVVGNAGLAGALIIITGAFVITATTGFSLSSITTNIRIGAGGAYSVISKSLGLEVAGSVGIPLYLSQALAVSMYIFGFREGWQFIFPHHPALAVDLVVFVAVLGIAAVSAGLAFRVQYVILALIVASLIAVFGTVFTEPLDEPIRWFGEFRGAPEDGHPGMSPWIVFAIFFPATTGIMAGANMSGELSDPRRSIPRGTIAAIAVSFVVYVAIAVWFARVAPLDELDTNYTLMVDRALWGPAVLGGLLGATFSSALASIVGAPRILQALASHRIIPGADPLAQTTRQGEPRNALLTTAVIVFAALMLRDLNAVAPLITMFFLITYGMINAVVLLEQSLGLVSFRPLLRIPRVVALIGTVGCVFAMFIINPAFSLVALTIVLVFYAYLVRRQLVAPYGDVRSGLLVAIAEWAVKRVTRMRGSRERAWKPNLLVPVEDEQELRGTFRLIHDIASPKGSLKIMGVATGSRAEILGAQLADAAGQFRDEEVFATWTVVETESYGAGFLAGMGAFRGALFRPNIVFLTRPDDVRRAEDLRLIVDRAPDHGLGVILYAHHPRTGLSRRRTINLWLRSPDWERVHEVAEIDLAILLAYKLQQNWDGRIRLLTVVGSLEQKPQVTAELRRLMDLARIPRAEVYAIVGTFHEAVADAPQADVAIFGLPSEADFDWTERMVDETRSSCLFVRGSGSESALA